LLSGHPLTCALFKQLPWHHYGLLGLEESLLSIRSPFLDNEFLRTVYRAPKSAGRDNEISLRLIAHGSPDLARIPTDRGLVKPDRGFFGMVARGLLQFTFRAEYAYDSGMPQWLARVNAPMPGAVERLFLGRHKFAHYRVWFRDQLANYVNEVLLDPRALGRPYLNRAAVEDMVIGHTEGTRNYTQPITQLLSLELLNRQFID
jgi:asparagine synthase (glutamine-hydrolysing)